MTEMHQAVIPMMTHSKTFGGSQLFATELGTNVVDIFSYAQGKMNGQIRAKFDSPYGVAVDPPLSQ